MTPNEVPAQTENFNYPSRLTFVDTVYFQPAEGDSVAFNYQGMEELQSLEVPYTRTIKLEKNKLQSIDRGWIEPDKCSLLILKGENINDRRDTVPEPSQVKDYEFLIWFGVELPSGEFLPLAEIRQGKVPLKLKPINLDKIRLLSVGKDAKINITLFPL